MHDIVNSVQQVNAIIRDITMATSEQRDGISQINTAVSQLDQMTQQKMRRWWTIGSGGRVAAV